MPEDKMRTPELMQRLRRHYIKPGPMPGGILVPECGRNGGWGSSSRCDALHVGFTSTSGRILTGHEVKVSRSDWLHELNQIDKADEWADQCHAWYLVTSDPDMVKAGELPAGWGHMVPGRSKTRMDVLVPATIHKDRQPSWDAVRSIMARLDTLQRQDLAQLRDDQQRSIRTDVEAELARRRSEQVPREVAASIERADRIEQALGVRIVEHSYGVARTGPDGNRLVTAEQVAAALDLLGVLDTLRTGWAGSLKTVMESLQAATDTALDAQKALDAIATVSERVDPEHPLG